jgi:hypothetical protein
MFESTSPGAYGEDRKARIKNENLPLLQLMYMGSYETPLACLISGSPAFVSVPDFVTGHDKIRFSVDFNHIRQKASGLKHSGHSIDKDQSSPSALFREQIFHQNKMALLEFMTIMPVSTQYHSYISQDSAKGDITLTNFKPEYWPWILKSKENFNDFCLEVKMTGLGYEWFIDHLSKVDYPSIHKRVSFQRLSTGPITPSVTAY